MPPENGFPSTVPGRPCSKNCSDLLFIILALKKVVSMPLYYQDTTENERVRVNNTFSLQLVLFRNSVYACTRELININ